jgi:hypothetical protein
MLTFFKPSASDRTLLPSYFKYIIQVISNVNICQVQEKLKVVCSDQIFVRDVAISRRIATVKCNIFSFDFFQKYKSIF